MKFFRKNIILCMLSMQFFFIALTMYEKLQSQTYYFKPCIADVLVFLSWKIYLAIIISPYVILITHMLMDADDNYNYIIRYKSRCRVFFKNIKDSVIFAFIFTAYCLLSIILWSKFFGFDNIVWNKYDSYFFVATHTTTNISFNAFIIKYGVVFLLIICIISFISVICAWVGNKILAILLCVVVFIVDFYMKDNSLMNYILFNYKEVDVSIQSNILYGVILLIIGILIGCIIAIRKEFYGNH